MILYQDLALRHNANILFDKIESHSENPVIVDFSDVRTMTRSFAQEYLLRKAKSSKTVEEINMSKNIVRMFKVAENVTDKAKLFDSKKLVVIDLE